LRNHLIGRLYNFERFILPFNSFHSSLPDEPGGNFIGVSIMAVEVGDNRLELLRETLPGMRSVVALGNARNPSSVASRDRVVVQERRSV
jgi:hypothetical protein